MYAVSPIGTGGAFLHLQLVVSSSDIAFFLSCFRCFRGERRNRHGLCHRASPSTFPIGCMPPHAIYKPWANEKAFNNDGWTASLCTALLTIRTLIVFTPVRASSNLPCRSSRPQPPAYEASPLRRVMATLRLLRNCIAALHQERGTVSFPHTLLGPLGDLGHRGMSWVSRPSHVRCILRNVCTTTFATFPHAQLHPSMYTREEPSLGEAQHYHLGRPRGARRRSPRACAVRDPHLETCQWPLFERSLPTKAWLC